MLSKNLILALLCLVIFCSSSIAQNDEALFRVWSEGKIGFINNKGDLVIKPQFLQCSFAFSFSENLAVFCTEGSDKAGFIDKTGKFVIEQKFDDAYSFSEGLAQVVFDNQGLHNLGRSGFIDKTGKIVIEPIYSNAFSFSEGLASVGKNGKYGFIDKDGQTKIPFEFDYAYSFSEDLAIVFKNENYGFINKKGEFLLEPKFKGAGSFSEGFAWVKNDGVACLPYTYTTCITYDNENSFSYIDKKGNTVFSIKASRVGNFSEGLAAIEIKSKFGFINKKGKLVIKLKQGFHPQLPKFSEGLAKITHDIENEYFIDKTGKNIFSKNFKSAKDFENGLAYVCEKETDLCGYINKKGRYIWKTKSK